MLQNFDAKSNNICFQRGFIPPDVLLIQKLDELIEQYFKVHKEAKFYCKKMQVTERMMNSHLKFHRKVTVFQLIWERIYREAESLLVHTNMTMQEITYELGISDPSYFSNIFKKARGLTPSEYRSSYVKEKPYAKAV